MCGRGARTYTEVRTSGEEMSGEGCGAGSWRRMRGSFDRSTGREEAREITSGANYGRRAS